MGLLLETLPDWPARMNADVACLYMGVSKATFLTRFGEEGVKEGANRLWARAQLDRIVARQFKLPQTRGAAPPRDTSWDDFR